MERIILSRSGFWGDGRYNRRMRRLLLLLATCAIVFAQKKPFDVNALLELKRIGDPQISPDGKLVAFTVQTVDVAANKKPVQVWIVPLEGGMPRQITQDGESNQRPRWSPDSKRIAYVSDRGGSSQIWMMDPDGGNAKQITNPVDRGRRATLLARRQESGIHQRSVSGMRSRRCVQPEESGRGKGQQGKGADLYRPALSATGTRWRGKRRSHLLVMPVAGGAVRDLTPGTRDVPPFSLGGSDDYDISPNGQEVCYSMNADPRPGHQHRFRSVRGLDRRRAAREDHHHAWARIPTRAIRRTESTSRGAPSSAPATKATAGG